LRVAPTRATRRLAATRKSCVVRREGDMGAVPRVACRSSRGSPPGLVNDSASARRAGRPGGPIICKAAGQGDDAPRGVRLGVAELCLGKVPPGETGVARARATVASCVRPARREAGGRPAQRRHEPGARRGAPRAHPGRPTWALGPLRMLTTSSVGPGGSARCAGAERRLPSQAVSRRPFRPTTTMVCGAACVERGRLLSERGSRPRGLIHERRTNRRSIGRGLFERVGQIAAPSSYMAATRRRVRLAARRSGRRGPPATPSHRCRWQ
jgi:hypothetical protein